VPTPSSVLVEAHTIWVFSLLNVQLSYLPKEIYILPTSFSFLTLYIV